MAAAMDVNDLPEAARNVPLVSLGNTSAAKVTFKKLGRAYEPLPFDWVFSTLDGLMNFVTNDFLGFYDFGGTCEMPVPGSSKSVSVFQSSMHVCRQDDPTSQPQTGYTSAIEQFKNLSARDGPLLFVRVAATSEEVHCAGILAQTLIETFGPWAALLLIVDDQGPNACGLCTVKSDPNLLIDYANTEKTGAAYVQSVCNALKWAAHLPIVACEAADLATVYSFRSRDTDWGLASADGRPVFLKINSGADSIKNTMTLVSTPTAPPVQNVRCSAQLEAAPVKIAQADAELDAIPVMSLGTSAAVKKSLREIGRGAEAFPFDWTNTTLDGVVHFLTRDFKNFFGYTSCVELNGVPTGFRSPLHSFWYDDISNEMVQEGYRTRIANMKAFDAKKSPMLFVREAATGDEVRQAGKLLQALNGTFGIWACLLLIIDNQGADAVGSIVVNQERGLILHFCNTQGGNVEAPYADIISKVLNWSCGRAMTASKVDTLAQAMGYLKDFDKGMYVGNSRAFDCEVAGEQADHFKFTAMLGAGDVQDSDLMEQIETKNIMEFLRDPETEHVQLVSLGCSCAPKMSFKSMGRGAETLPFDWMRTTLQGVYSFITSDFAGFYDFQTRMDVRLDDAPDMVMFRGEEHSFWHDDPTTESMHEKYGRRINRFKALDAQSQAVLFVRGAATSDEVADAGTVSRELRNRFGQHATLLMVVDFQGPTAKGVVTVDSEPNLMLYFNDTKVCNQSAPHIEAVRGALDWVVGRKVMATAVPTLADAAQFVHVVSHYGLRGTSGVPAFESVLNDPRLTEAPRQNILAPSMPAATNTAKADDGHGGRLPRMHFQGGRRPDGKSPEPAPEPPAEFDRDRRFARTNAQTSKSPPNLPEAIKSRVTPKAKASESSPANRVAVNVSPVKKGTENKRSSFDMVEDARTPLNRNGPSPRHAVQMHRRASPSPPPVIAMRQPSGAPNAIVPDALSQTRPQHIPVPTSYGIPTGHIPVPTSYGPSRDARQRSPGAPVPIDRRPSIELDRRQFDLPFDVQGFVPERTVSDLFASAPSRANGQGRGSYVAPPNMLQMGPVPQVSTLPKQQGIPQVHTGQAQAQIGKVPQVRTIDALAQMGRVPTQAQMGRVPQVRTLEAQPQHAQVPQPLHNASWTPMPTASMGAVPAHLFGPVPQVSTIPRAAEQDAAQQRNVLDASRRSLQQIAVPQFVSPVPNMSANMPPGFGSGVIPVVQVPDLMGSYMNLGGAPQVVTNPRGPPPFGNSPSLTKELRPGMRANISGVDDSNQALKVNGKICTLISFDAAKRKWVIRLPEGSTARVPVAALSAME